MYGYLETNIYGHLENMSIYMCHIIKELKEYHKKITFQWLIPTALPVKFTSQVITLNRFLVKLTFDPFSVQITFLSVILINLPRFKEIFNR